MIAQESNDENMVANALSTLVSACTYGKVDADKIPMFDNWLNGVSHQLRLTMKL